MFITRGMPENEINIDIRLTPEERMRLVMSALIELIEDKQHKEALNEFINEIEVNGNDNGFLIDFGFLLKDIVDRGNYISDEQKEYVHSKWKEIETEMSQEPIEDDIKSMKPIESIEDDRHRHRQKDDERLAMTLKKKKNSRNKVNQQKGNSNKKYTKTKTIEQCIGDRLSNNKNHFTLNLKHSYSSFSIVNAKEKPIPVNGFKLDSTIQRLSQEIKPNKKKCNCLNMLIGIQHNKEDLFNNEDTNANHIQYTKFVYPTKSILEATQSQLSKYNMTYNTHNPMITFTNDSLSNSIMKIIQSEEHRYLSLNPKPIPRSNQSNGIISYNDSMICDNNQNGQPMTHISSISNIPKGTRNSDVNSNNCTLLQCLNKNWTHKSIGGSIDKNKNNKDIVKKAKSNVNVKSKNSSMPKKPFSPKKLKNDIKVPNCFIVLEKSNIRIIKSQITKLTIGNKSHFKPNI